MKEKRIIGMTMAKLTILDYVYGLNQLTIEAAAVVGEL